jgi:glycosyltransferase involved in cell wall biosynthesis
MKVSLVLCTIGRIDSINAVLHSFEAQTYKDFECIIVDQNQEDILSSIIASYKEKFKIIHLRSKVKGLSANRNLGISKISGDVIAFPDDDCEYLPTTLQEVIAYFDSHKEVDVLTINFKDPHKESYFINNNSTINLDRYNYRPFGISIGIFIKYRNKNDVQFDEQLGVGSSFGADEESDLLSSLLEKGYNTNYCGSLYVLHLVGLPNLSEDKLIRRYETYGLGYGALLKKEIVYRRKYRLILLFIKDTFGRLIAGFLPVKKRKYYLVSALARIKGFVLYKKNYD